MFIQVVCLLIWVCQLALAGANSNSNSNSLEWQLYKQKHGKLCANVEEEARRFANFMAAKRRVEQHNKLSKGNPFRMGLNHLSDWAPEEIGRMLYPIQATGPLPDPTRKNSPQERAFLDAILSDPRPLPAEVDWRKVPNRVAQVKSQGQCGSCWAFATVGALEGQQVWRNFSESLVALSEQELVDCTLDVNHGCRGGWTWKAMEALADMKGLASEQAYPYAAKNGDECKLSDSSRVIMSLAGAAKFEGERRLEKVVAAYGPVAVSIFVTIDLFHYKSGVFSDSKCKPHAHNHAVLVVGYGTHPVQGDYWLIKNSWGPEWGEQGYFRLKRGVNMCTVSEMAAIPTFSEQ